MASDPEQVEADDRLVVATVASLVHHPGREQERGEREQGDAQRAVPGALLDERHQDRDDGGAEQHDAERVQVGTRLALLAVGGLIGCATPGSRSSDVSKVATAEGPKSRQIEPEARALYFQAEKAFSNKKRDCSALPRHAKDL